MSHRGSPLCHPSSDLNHTCVVTPAWTHNHPDHVGNRGQADLDLMCDPSMQRNALKRQGWIFCFPSIPEKSNPGLQRSLASSFEARLLTPFLPTGDRKGRLMESPYLYTMTHKWYLQCSGPPPVPGTEGLRLPKLTERLGAVASP